MTRIAAVATQLADHRYEQAAITEAFGDFVTKKPSDRALLERLHAATGVQTRHLALPLEVYPTLRGFTESNETFIRVACDLGSRAIDQALAACDLATADIDLFISTTVTGVAAPSIDALLTNRMGFRADVKRLPLFGLGCVAGAAALARAHDYLAGHPTHAALVLSVELCSLTVQQDDTSVANLVASGLFGDAAAAVVLLGSQHPRATPAQSRIMDSVSRMFPDTERVMGWDIGGSGFRVVLAPTVADLVRTHVGGDVKGFLADNDLHSGVARYIAHPGGPRVLDALEEALEVDRSALGVTWDSLALVGNLSSASVLHVLQQTMAAEPTGTGEPTLLMAMGPGFCAEYVLLAW